MHLTARRWIYKLPKTWTQDDYDATKAASDLAYSHMAMLTLLPDGRLASLMQVPEFRVWTFGTPVDEFAWQLWVG